MHDQNIFLLSTQVANLPVSYDGSVTMTLQSHAIYTLTTINRPELSNHSMDIPASTGFPMNYSDNFDGYSDQQVVKYFTDQASD